MNENACKLVETDSNSEYQAFGLDCCMGDHKVSLKYFLMFLKINLFKFN